MSNAQHDMAERLKKARIEAKFESPTDAARAMGVEPPTYLGHENGSRGFRASAPRYGDFFRVNLEWLLTGRGAMKRTGSLSETATAATVQIDRKKETELTVPELNLRNLVNDLPILGSGACGENGLFEMNGQALGMTKRPPKLIGIKDAYALYVSGDSMEPWRFRGRLVYVHPHQPPQIGDFVVVQLHAEDGTENKPAYIKRLVRRTAKELRLFQYNPPEEKSFPMSKVHSVHRIIDTDEAMGV
jgi:phage repressor protein C with HTH and peptisase S24 domain